MNGYTSLKKGSGMVTRQFATDALAYGAPLSGRVVCL